MKFQIVESKEERREARRLALIERAVRYKKLYESMTLTEIAVAEGITRERVRQIMALIGITRKDGWRYKLSLSKSAAAEARAVRDRNERCLRIYGCSWSEYCATSGYTRYVGVQKYPHKGTGLIYCYHQHRDNAHRLGIPWTISLPEFSVIIGDRIKYIGRGKLHFARKDKTKPFTADNCELISNSENSSETRKQARARGMQEILHIVERMNAAGMSCADISRTVGRSPHTIRQQLYRIGNKTTFGEGK